MGREHSEPRRPVGTAGLMPVVQLFRRLISRLTSLAIRKII